MRNLALEPAASDNPFSAFQADFIPRAKRNIRVPLAGIEQHQQQRPVRIGHFTRRLMQGNDFVFIEYPLPWLAPADDLGRLHHGTGRSLQDVLLNAPREEPLGDGEHAVRHVRRLSRNWIDNLAYISPINVGDGPIAPRLNEAPQRALGVFALALLAQLLLDEGLGDGGERICSLTGFGHAFALELDARVLTVFEHLYPLRGLLPALLQRNHGIAPKLETNRIAAAEAVSKHEGFGSGRGPQAECGNYRVPPFDAFTGSE